MIEDSVLPTSNPILDKNSRYFMLPSIEDILIHVIDDDPSVRKAIRRLLQSMGFRAKAYASAKEFLKEKNEIKSCIILDVQLEGMSGPELQQHLIDMGLRIPIVFITSHDDESIRKRIEQTGAPFLRKPVEGRQLLEAIQRAMKSFAS